MPRRALDNVCDWLLLYVVAYARCNGNCFQVSWYDCPNGILNLNDLHGILIICCSSCPIGDTLTECLCTLITHTSELLAKPRPLIAWVTKQTSPIFNIRLWLGTPFSPKKIGLLWLTFFYVTIWIIHLLKSVPWQQPMFIIDIPLLSNCIPFINAFIIRTKNSLIKWKVLI